MEIPLILIYIFGGAGIIFVPCVYIESKPTMNAHDIITSSKCQSLANSLRKIALGLIVVDSIAFVILDLANEHIIGVVCFAGLLASALLLLLCFSFYNRHMYKSSIAASIVPLLCGIYIFLVSVMWHL